MSDPGLPVLWHIEISHYNEKARWALDWKGVDHVRKAPQPGLHSFKARRLTGASTLPILELEGRAIGDSTRIIAELEQRFPEPPLYPDDPEERRRALELEDFFDEQVAPDVRRLVFFHILRWREAPAALAEISHAGRVQAGALRMAMPLLRLDVRRRYGVEESVLAGALDHIRAGLERIERSVGQHGYLVGQRFSVADLSAAALLAPLACPEMRPYPVSGYPPSLQEIQASLESPAFEWVRDMHARHRPVSAEVPA